MRSDVAVAVLEDSTRLVKTSGGRIRVESPAVKDALRTLSRNSQSSKWALTAHLEDVRFLESVDPEDLGGAAQAVLTIAQKSSGDIHKLSHKLTPVIDMLVEEGDLDVTLQCLSLLETENAHQLLAGAFHAGALRYIGVDALIATSYQLAITDTSSSRCALSAIQNCGIPEMLAASHVLFRELRAQTISNSPALVLS